MATTQTLAVLTPENKTFYDRSLLKRLLPNLLYVKYGQKRPLPKNEGDTINFRRIGVLAVATTPLTEGVTPGGNTLSIATVNATVQQYGDFLQLSDKVDMLGIDPLLTETSDLLGEQAGKSIDTVARDIIVAGTTVQYANGRASRVTVAAGDNFNGTEIKKSVRTLRRNDARPQEGQFYIGIIHPDTQYDLMADTMWQDVSKYNKAMQIFEGEIGTLYGVRFVVSSNAKKFTGAGAAGIDVYATMIIGSDAYGVVDVNGSAEKPEMIVKAHGSAGTSDPLNQIATAGWKATFTTVRLNESAMVRVEHAATP